LELGTDFEIGTDDLADLYQANGKKRTEAGGDQGFNRDGLTGIPYGSPGNFHVRGGKAMRKHLERKAKMMPPMPTLHKHEHHPNATHFQEEE
jgi:hypothetical protein